MSGSPIQLVKRYLCVKKLTVNDGFTSKSVKLPRAEARIFMGELRNRQVIPLVLLDEGGGCWELVCTCTGAQYAISRIGAFCEAHGARPGFYFIFYADHDHVVRLAVRQQLPEDVQAAVAAARAAAVAVRATPQRTATQHQPQPAGPAVSSSAAATPCPAGEPVPPAVLDDAMPIDEMPAHVATCDAVALRHDDEPLSSVASVPVQQLVDAEPPSRPMPLQDRSNLPAGPADSANTKSAGKPKPKPAIRRSSQPSAAGDTSTSSVAVATQPYNKENDAAALPHPAEKVQAAASSAPLISSGGLQAPCAVTPIGRTSLQPQPVPRPAVPPTPPSPRPPALSSTLQPTPVASAMAQRALVSQQALPPATRLRLRFEARLCAMAGKLHPLSVRTGPESPLPSSSGLSSGAHAAGANWPITLSGCYALPRSSPLGKDLFTVPCAAAAATAAHSYPAYGYLPGGLPTDMQPHHGSPAPYSAGLGTAASCSMSGAQLEHHFSARQPQRTGPCGPAMVAAPAQDQLTVYGNGPQELQCHESLDWDGCGSSGPARTTPAGHRQPPPPQSVHQYHVPHPPLQPPPNPQPLQQLHAGGPGGPAAVPQVNLGFVRRLLLLQGSQASAQRLVASWGGMAGADSQSQQPRPLQQGDQQQLLQRQLQVGEVAQRKDADQRQPAHAAAEPTWEELLLSVAASNYSLRRLLGVFRTWSPQLHAAGAPPAQPPEDAQRVKPPSSGSIPAGDVAGAAPMASRTTPHGGCSAQERALALGVGSSSRMALANQAHQTLDDAATTDTEMADCGQAADASVPRRHSQVLPEAEEAVCGGGARAKSSLSIAREAPGLPADAPRCKRPRPESWQMVARKTLTSHDLLMDRVALSLAPATRALMGKLLLAPRGRDSPTTGGDGSGDGAQELPQPQDQQAAAELETGETNQLPERLVVEVVVESGAQYSGVMVACTNAAGGVGAGAGAGAGSGAVAGAQGSGDWELQGLRSYLIRRQAGVGDVLTLRIDSIDAQQRAGCLRLVAQLQQQQAAA